MLRIVDTPLLWATFFLRCVPSVYRYGTEPDDGRTAETCSYVYISNILTYDSDVA
jgi:hypothetical protein